MAQADNRRKRDTGKSPQGGSVSDNGRARKAKYTEKNEMRKQIAGIIIKLPLCLVAALLLVLLIVTVVQTASDRLRYTDADTGRIYDLCSSAFHNGDYGRLRDDLERYDTKGEEYDLFWEAVDAYRDYLFAEEFRVSGDTEQAAFYAERVTENAANCRHKENSRILAGYAEKFA